MKLNVDCIRDVLQYCTKTLDFKPNGDSWEETFVSLNMLYNSELKDIYECKDIMYSVLKLEECHFIKILKKFPENKTYLDNCIIVDVTYRGHQFLETIKDVKVWEKTKSIAKKVGNHTLTFIEDTAQKLTIEIAKQIISNSINA